MDMLAYFLGRLAEGGADDAGGTSYKSITYNDDDTITLIGTDDTEHTMVCTYEDGVLTSVTYDGAEIAIEYDGDKLIVDKTEIDLSNVPITGSDGNVPDSGGTGVVSNNSTTSYEVWGETLTIAYNSDAEMNIAECTKDITNIKTSVYKIFIDDNSYNALVLITDEGIMINISDGNMCMIASDGESTFFGTTINEGEHTIRLISQTNDIEDYVVYSQNIKTEPTTCIYVTNGFTMGNAQVSISTNGEIIFDKEVTFEGIDGYVYHYSYTIFPCLSEYIEQGKTIVIRIIQTNSDGVIVTKTINSSPQLVDGYNVWGNSDLFALPS